MARDGAMTESNLTQPQEIPYPDPREANSPEDRGSGEVAAEVAARSLSRFSHPVARSDMRAASILSVLLHGLLLGLFLLARTFDTDHAKTKAVMTVDLVELGTATTSPEAARLAAVPQQRAKEIATRPSDDAIPSAGGSVSPTAKSSTSSRATRTTATQTASLSNQKAPKSRTTESTIARTDPLSVRLQALARLVEPSAVVQPSPDNQDGTGLSNATAATANSNRGLTATYSVRDFIRAQVLRRWYVGNQTATRNGWSVTIHIRLRPDGTVALAEVVDIARYRNNRGYFDFALSARNAVELSSPLSIPPGSYEIAKDVTIEFDAREVQ
ncbi:MAG TPA: cell envelope integrity protein TolA [Bradyrhizobium sp.]|nr:cell envelope integrity protein TolA [Bradyrhizobium sp.]